MQAAAHALCADTALPLPERALYASLCGALPALLPACPAYEDALWAHHRAAVEARVTHALRARPLAARPAPADDAWPAALPRPGALTFEVPCRAQGRAGDARANVPPPMRSPSWPTSRPAATRPSARSGAPASCPYPRLPSRHRHPAILTTRSCFPVSLRVPVLRE